MSWPETANNVNEVLKQAVRVQTRCGSNRTGAIATIAEFLGVSPQIIKMRINDEIVGHPRSKKLISDRCWTFMALILERERAWVERLAAEVEQNRLQLQLSLPFEGNANVPRNQKVAADRVSRDEADITAARRALAEFETMKRRNGRGR